MNKSSLRRIRSQIRAGLFFNDSSSDVAQGYVAIPEDVLASAFGDTESPAGDEGHGQEVRRRSRSVSDSLGDFFGVRRNKRRKDDHQPSSDVEEGTAAGISASTTDPRFDEDATVSRPFASPLQANKQNIATP
jgi:hypothetical protein